MCGKLEWKFLSLGSKNNFADNLCGTPRCFGLSLHIAYGKLRKLPEYFISSSTCESVLIWVVLVFLRRITCAFIIKNKEFFKKRGNKLSFLEHIWNIVFSSGFHIFERT